MLHKAYMIWGTIEPLKEVSEPEIVASVQHSCFPQCTAYTYVDKVGSDVIFDGTYLCMCAHARHHMQMRKHVYVNLRA